MYLISELIFVCFIAIYSYLVTHFIPKRLYSFSNIVITIGSVIYGSLIGLSTTQMAINPSYLTRGFITGIIISLPIIITILLISTSKRLRHHFSKTPRSQYNLRTFIYETTFRIPFGTAFSEEIIFRGVLLALLLKNHSWVVAIILSAIFFGLWHIIPTLHTIKENDPLISLMDDQRRRNVASVMVAVGTTSLVGIIFAVMRLWSDSFATSWLVHTSINGFAIIGGYITVWFEHRKANN